MVSLLTVSKAEKPIPGRYIVTLKDEVSLATHVGPIQASIATTTSNITHEFSLINGYAGEFTDKDLNDLRANPDVASIEQDSIFQICEQITQNDATWGLGRISSKEKLTGNDKDLNFKYKYDSTAGKGVTVYVIDTGIDIDHPAFEGRASWGKTFGGYDDKDVNGHGTHCAGTAVSGPYGVAKASKVVAVKVMGDRGLGCSSDIIAGIDWVANQVRRTGNPSVTSMSIASDVSIAMDTAIKGLYDSGVTVVVAAGNDNKDASNYSPARVEQAITVAASDINDTKANFSNYGAPVNIWAAGLNVISTWPGGKTHIDKGTSMAAPHVAGFAAYLLGLDSSLTPAKIATIINEKALDGVLSGVPDGTINKLLNNPL